MNSNSSHHFSKFLAKVDEHVKHMDSFDVRIGFKTSFLEKSLKIPALITAINLLHFLDYISYSPHGYLVVSEL